ALYGTAAILILAYTTRFLPIAYASSSAAMRSISPEMEEAVRILGGGRLTAIRKVLAPLIKKSLAGAWLLGFIPATPELSAAVDGVDLAIEPGEFVSLLGPSGCGKTTTLRMIAGFIDPSAGLIEMDGQVLSSPARSLPPERRGMSMIFQSYAVWPNMTVGEN